MNASSLLEIAADHPSFAGHFPKFPVLPGAVLLDEALQVIERDRGIDLTAWKVASVKFLDVVRPGDALRLDHDAPKNGLIRFTIHVADRMVAAGSLSSVPAVQLHPPTAAHRTPAPAPTPTTPADIA